LEQGFVLIRLIPEFKSVFGTDEEFPLETKKFTKDGREYNITVDKEKLFGSELLMKIKVEYEEGAYYTFEMFVLGGQLVISFGGGV
ncbi:MAG TPA: hypothetical protein VN451_01270, partial [Chitinophagaceae bacterium]|nr:hypothetical protein [Chitinophagaceae bacterium]